MLWNILLAKWVMDLQKAFFAGGFVFPNEPTGRLFLGGIELREKHICVWHFPLIRVEVAGH